MLLEEENYDGDGEWKDDEDLEGEERIIGISKELSG